MYKTVLSTLLVGVIIAGAYHYSVRPQLNREWSLDQAVLPYASFAGDEVTIYNVRNFTYTSASEATPAYYDTTVQLSELERVDYIVEPFGNIGAAHTFLSFGFRDGQQIALSVEIRKEVGESFSAWRGLWKQYELMYVIADERDVIGLRANHRNHPVYVYPANVEVAKAERLFRSMLERANSLVETPEFYHTILNNCTTNIARHINHITPSRVPLDVRLLLPRNSDVLAQELGFIAQDIDIETARERYLVNERASMYADSPDFSKLIREKDSVIQPVTSVPKNNDVDEKLSEEPLVASEDISQNDTTLPIYRVTRVIDGDTIEVDIRGMKERVRYLGIDTPETVHPSEPVACYGTEASERNKELVQGRYVQLDRDITDRDTYGRLLRYVWIDGVLVNYLLVAEGYATAVTYPPDVRYTELFLEAEKQARFAQRGLWGDVCQNLDTGVVQKEMPTLLGHCVIKGNISQTTGEKIFHVPGCEYYSETIITENFGERWFCSEGEASAAGWRKAQNCPE